MTAAAAFLVAEAAAGLEDVAEGLMTVPVDDEDPASVVVGLVMPVLFEAPLAVVPFVAVEDSAERKTPPWMLAGCVYRDELTLDAARA